MSDEKRMNELIEIEKKYMKSQEIAKRARLKRSARIKLELKRYEEGVKSGVIKRVSDEEIKVELER